MEFKYGRGNKSNSSSWYCAHDTENDTYLAVKSFGSAQGHWFSLWKINEETWKQVGTFEDDDYKSERLISEGELIYKLEDERNYPMPDEVINDSNYKTLFAWYYNQEYKK